METLATASPTTGRDALRFTIYNAVRSNETRFALWTEFDLDKAIWTIPGERMMAKETHIVPLSATAVALLRRRWNERANDTGLVFSANGEKPMSDMTMTKLLRDGGIQGVTFHGFPFRFHGLGGRENRFPEGSCRQGAGAQIDQSGRGRLSPDGFSGEAARSDGAVGTAFGRWADQHSPSRSRSGRRAYSDPRCRMTRRWRLAVMTRVDLPSFTVSTSPSAINS